MAYTFGDNEFVSESKIGNPLWRRAFKQPEMHLLHGRYHKQEFEHIMGPKTIYITMLRDPVSHYTSIYNYYGQAAKFRRKLPTLISLPAG